GPAEVVAFEVGGDREPGREEMAGESRRRRRFRGQAEDAVPHQVEIRFFPGVTYFAGSGSPTTFNNSSTMSSAAFPSACPWKFAPTLCRSTGTAALRTSSIATE